MKEAINDYEIFPAIQKLFSGVIPELCDDFFKQYNQVPFAFLEDDTGIVFHWNTDKKVIEFSSKSLRVVWLFTIAIWQVYNEEAQNCLNIKGINQTIKTFVDDCYVSAMELLQAPSEDQFKWPKNILHPEDVVIKNKDLNEDEEACFKLACFALSFIFLHEYNHAINNHSAITGRYAVNEEFESDEFAINMLIDGVKKYSEQTGQNLYKLYLLRFLGIFFGLVFLYKHEQIYGNNEESHPLVKKRMEQLISKILRVELNGKYIFEDNDEIFSIIYLILKSEVNLVNLDLNNNNTAKDIVVEIIRNL